MSDQTSAFNFRAVQTNLDLADALTKLKEHLLRARESGSIDETSADLAIKEITWAIKEAIMPVPSRAALLDHLVDAKESLTGKADPSRYAAALKDAARALQRLP